MADDDAPQLTLDLAKDRTSMRLALTSKGKIDAGVILNAKQYDAIIAAMMAIRAEMVPEVPKDFPVDSPTHGMHGTHYHFGYDPVGKQIILSLRNSGIGWISFRFEPDKFQDMLDEQRQMWGLGGQKSGDGPHR
jgi:hypothetical protein